MTPRALLAWWRSDFDYAWLPEFLDRRSLSSTLRVMIGFSCFVIGICGLLILASDERPANDVAFGTVLVLALSAFYAGVRWPMVEWPTERRSLVFLAWADCALALAVAVGIHDPQAALPGCGLFMITGMYATLMHSPRIIAVHIVFALAVCVELSLRVLLTTDANVPFLAVQTIVVVGVIVFPAATLQTALQLLKRDAATSYRDPLTDLFNRRGLADGVDRLVARMITADSVLVTLVMDLDGFKELNDAHGHTEGDNALRAVAGRLTIAIPEGGILGRLGGDEFAAMFTVASADVDREVTHIHQAVSSLEHRLPLTASTGVWAIRTTDLTGMVRRELFHEVIKRADFAMYEAKRAGGGQIVRQP